MKKRWGPNVSESAIKRTIVLNDALWEWARDQPEGASGLVRRLLEQERHTHATRRVLSVMTSAGEMQAISDGEGMILLLEDDAVLYWSVEEGQPVPVMRIPALPTQVVSVNLHPDQIITIPLKRGQTVTIPTPVTSLEKRKAEARARRAAKDAPDTHVDGGEGSEGREEVEGQ